MQHIIMYTTVFWNGTEEVQELGGARRKGGFIHLYISNTLLKM